MVQSIVILTNSPPSKMDDVIITTHSHEESPRHFHEDSFPSQDYHLYDSFDSYFLDSPHSYYASSTTTPTGVSATVPRMSPPYLTITFSMLQLTMVLIMILQCTISPLYINPTIGPPPEVLNDYGGTNTFLILHQHQYWRLVTPILLHAGILHLLCNLYLQLDRLAFLELEWGSGIWFMIYMTSGISSSIWSCCLKPDTISVGCSGSIMGLLGAKLAQLTCQTRQQQQQQRLQPTHDGDPDDTTSRGQVQVRQLHSTLALIGIILLFSFVPYLNVDWAAHLGGLLGGFGVGLYIWWNGTWDDVDDGTTHDNDPNHKPGSGGRIIIGMTLVLGYGILLYYMTHVIEPKEDLENMCLYYQQRYQDYTCHCQVER